MKPQGVGVIESPIDEKYLAYDWYTSLTATQLEAYVRYLFIALRENAYDVDAPAQTKYRLNWDGGENNYGHKHKRIWSKIVSEIRKYKAVPGAWVAAHFSPSFHAVRIAESKGYVDNRPELLCSPLSPDVYRKHLSTFDQITIERCVAAEVSVATEMSLLESVIKDRDDLILYVVADKTNVNATPFFRHAFAAYYDCVRGVERYIAQAAVEYDMNQQLYDDLAAKQGDDWWISPALKKVVADNRMYWSKYRG